MLKLVEVARRIARGNISAEIKAESADEKGRFKFDRAGRYSINFGVFSGNSFTGGWNNTIVGTVSPLTNLSLKQLYFSARPVKGVELQYGGLSVQRGESTEITSYDNDAYLVGERLILKRPKGLFFDEISITYAYPGDLSTPKLNKRYHRLKESNYHQFLVGKQLPRRAAVSVDYTFVAGAETMREAVKLNTPELRVIDSVRFENYQRTDMNPAYGFSLAGEKMLRERLPLGGGFAATDRNYGGLNSDRFNRGHRLFASGSFSCFPADNLCGRSPLQQSHPVFPATRHTLRSATRGCEQHTE